MTHSGAFGRRSLIAGAAAVVSGIVLSGGPAAAEDRARGGSGRVPKVKHEMRGMWVATVVNIDFPSKAGLTADQQRAELIAQLDVAVARRLNAVVLQVRPTADAFWPSSYEPWSEYLTGVQGQDPGWDPLGTAVEEAHKRGLELHGWFNPYRIAMHADPSRLVADHPARLHPEWVVPYGGKLYYNPGLPEVREFVQKAMLDAVHRYDLDAVHFDDYFYPYPVAGQSFDDNDAYARHGAGFPDKAAWRRDNTDQLILGMAKGIKETRKGVKFGISPFGVWRNKATDPALGSDTQAGVQTYDDLYADTRKWVRENWIDYIAPQLYWNIGLAVADYAKLIPWWADVAAGTGTDLYIGEAVYKVGLAGQPAAWQDPAELSKHLTLAAGRPEVKGHIFYSAKFMKSDPLGAVSKLVADHYS
ncbi:glycoside hydrolase family 10 protein [Streptomyces sp. NPDC060194]|uniref:glycoside hydrolase family 10 protein n=1 Tax=Streptomyces sp. NPDC060194 TaxID=3347069 RepID=UPI00365ED23A